MEDEKRLLYHGTDHIAAQRIEKLGIDLHCGRSRLDFGRGFYLTNQLGTARKHAKDVAFRNHTKACFLKFKLDCAGLSLKKFPEPNEEWADEIYNQRKQDFEDKISEDVVIGPIADSGVRDLVEDLDKGGISREEFYRMLSQRLLGMQFTIKTEKAKQQLVYVGKERVQ